MPKKGDYLKIRIYTNIIWEQWCGALCIHVTVERKKHVISEKKQIND